MRTHQAKVVELQVDRNGQVSALLSCPPAVIPSPGQYVLAAAEGGIDGALPISVFAAKAFAEGFLAAPPLPTAWVPGTSLCIRGPIGRGFKLPGAVRRLALSAIGNSLDRLLGLAEAGIVMGADIAWFTDAPLPDLPASHEFNPLQALPDALSWADFLALDMPVDSLKDLQNILGRPSGEPLPCPVEALVEIPMPCGGAAECGVCAVPARRGWKLVCQDGPVFNLEDLDWRSG